MVCIPADINNRSCKICTSKIYTNLSSLQNVQYQKRKAHACLNTHPLNTFYENCPTYYENIPLLKSTGTVLFKHFLSFAVI